MKHEAKKQECEEIKEDLFMLFQLIFVQDFFNDWKNLLSTCFNIFLLKKLSRHEISVHRLEK